MLFNITRKKFNFKYICIRKNKYTYSLVYKRFHGMNTLNDNINNAKSILLQR